MSALTPGAPTAFGIRCSGRGRAGGTRDHWQSGRTTSWSTIRRWLDPSPGQKDRETWLLPGQVVGLLRLSPEAPAGSRRGQGKGLGLGPAAAFSPPASASRTRRLALLLSPSVLPPTGPHSAVHPSGPGLLFGGGFFITSSISVAGY